MKAEAKHPEDRSKPLLGRTYDDVHSELLHPPD